MRRKSDDPEIAKIAETIERQIRQLGRLTEDLADAAAVCRGAVHLSRQPVDLRAVVGGAAEAAAHRCRAAGHDLSVKFSGDPVPVKGDPDRLARVVGIPIENAVKFTPRSAG